MVIATTTSKKNTLTLKNKHITYHLEEGKEITAVISGTQQPDHFVLNIHEHHFGFGITPKDDYISIILGNINWKKKLFITNNENAYFHVFFFEKNREKKRNFYFKYEKDKKFSFLTEKEYWETTVNM